MNGDLFAIPEGVAEVTQVHWEGWGTGWPLTVPSIRDSNDSVSQFSDKAVPILKYPTSTDYSEAENTERQSTLNYKKYCNR